MHKTVAVLCLSIPYFCCDFKQNNSFMFLLLPLDSAFRRIAELTARINRKAGCPAVFVYAETGRTVILFSYLKTIQKVFVLAFIVFENQLACVVCVGFIKPYLRFFERAAFFAQL